MSQCAARFRDRPEFLVGLVLFLLLVATSASYGWHRDELYFVVAGQHPAWGYPDQPLFTPLLVGGLNALGGGSLVAVRIASDVAAAATAIIAGALAGALGGSPRARLISSLTWAVGGVSLVTGHFVDTTTFDILATAAVCLCLVRAITEQSGRWMIAAGGILGLGLLNKMMAGAIIGLVVLALAAVGPRSVMFTKSAVFAIGLAILGAAPYLIWQAMHGWPQIALAKGISQGGAEGGRIGVIPFQLILISPFLSALWIAGLVRILRSRTFRAFGIAYLVMLLLLIASSGKAYYAAGLLPILVGSGAVATDLWIDRSARRAKLVLVSVSVAFSLAINAVIGLSIIPIPLMSAVGVDKVNPDAGEQVGWDSFAEAVARGYQTLPAHRRAAAVIFTQNYAQAGAIDKFGPALGLPAAFSGHNGFADWGPPRATGPVELVGFESGDSALRQFIGCRVVAKVDNRFHLNNQEEGDLIWDCTAPRGSWSVVWPALVHYD